MTKTLLRELASLPSSTRFGGLIGRGISHSLSPFIHNTSARLLGMDAAYIKLDLEEFPPDVFFEEMGRENCFGFNVTVPFKEVAAARFAAGQCISCNTLVNQGGTWTAASTDGEGFCLGLKDIDRELHDFQAIVFMGYGGAVKALVERCQTQVPHIPLVVLKRGPLPSPIEAGRIRFMAFEPLSLQDVLSTYPESLLIQGTSAPLRGDDLSLFRPSIRGLKGAFVDLVYGRPSALLEEAGQKGILSQDGVPMLLGQALEAQKLWWGQSADFSAMKAALSTHLG